jgi:hypothetical protein
MATEIEQTSAETKPRPTMREMIDRLKALNAPKAASVTVVGSDGLTADSINAPNAEVQILPDFMRQEDQPQEALPDFMRQIEQVDEIAPDQIAAIDEAARQDATIELEPIAWEPDPTAGETYPEVYDDAPIQYTAHGPALETTPATPNVEGDIVYPDQQQKQKAPIAEILAESPAPASEPLAEEQALEATPELTPTVPEQRSAPILWQDGEEYDPSLRRYFDLGSNPEHARVQSASYFTRFEGAGLGDPITDAERGIPERSPYIEINGEAVTMEEFRALDPAQIRTADLSQVDGMQEANLPNCTEFHARDCPDLERLNLPAADRVSAVDCAQLETISAETATQVSARGCDALTEIDAPKADQITVSECPSIKKIQNDNASYVSADDCEKLTVIDTPNARWVSAADCPALESINAPEAERVRAENCNALTDAKVNAPEDAYFKAHTPDLVEAQKPVETAEQTRAPETAMAPETTPKPTQERSQAYEMTM